MNRRRFEVVTAVAIAVVAVVIGSVAMVALAGRDPDPAARATVVDAVDSGQYLAVAVNAYTAGGVVEQEGIRLAALSVTPVRSLPQPFRGYATEITSLRSRGPAAMVAELRSADEQGVNTLSGLERAGFEASEAVAVALGPLTDARLDQYLDNGADIADLDIYVVARSDLNAIDADLPDARATFLERLAALQRAPLGRSGADPGPLLGVGASMAAVVLACGLFLVSRVRQGQGDAQAVAERHAQHLAGLALLLRRIARAPMALLLDTLAEEAAWASDADFAVVLSRTDDGLVPVAEWGDVDLDLTDEGPATSGLVAQALQSGRPQAGVVSDEPLLRKEAGSVAVVASAASFRDTAIVTVVGRRDGPVPPDDAVAAVALLTDTVSSRLPDLDFERDELVLSPDLAEASKPASVPTGASPLDEIVVLAPDVVMRRAGEAVRLPGSAARLVAVLVAERRPVTVDRLVDLLWPEIDIDAGRNRLNVTIHRLRKAARLEADELVIRSADGVALVPGTAWSVDAWRFVDLARTAGEDVAGRVAAVALYGADLCARQFAYEDALIVERDLLHAQWGDLVASLVTSGDLDPVAAADHARSVGIDVDRDADLVAVLRAHLATAGHPALSEALGLT